MAATNWSIEGTHLTNCNCAYGCPCQYVALPTDGTCKAVLAWRIDKGHFGDTRLDGLLAVNLYSWPGPIHRGNGSMQSIVDERADAVQRKALAAILQGEGAEPGSSMLTIYRAMCTTYHDPLFKPIELELDMGRRTARLRVPGVVDTSVEPLKNPVTGAEHRARIDLPMGKEFRLAEVASGTTKARGAISLDFANSHAHFADATLTSGGLAV
ncbi:MAG: DUF1326 domain-containing protein [Candidatus Lambdaproteobacteria bacterium]|nr:DUF1326 domain-containing protein [Candidatus Lambdaproteobacteria bacterium]